VVKANVFQFEGDNLVWDDRGIWIDGKRFEGPLGLVDLVY
jgi:hypothetical protein